jgi:hypothetical protein
MRVWPDQPFVERLEKEEDTPCTHKGCGSGPQGTERSWEGDESKQLRQTDGATATQKNQHGTLLTTAMQYRPPAAVTSELQSRAVDVWSTRHLLHDTAQILQFLAHCILGQGGAEGRPGSGQGEGGQIGHAEHRSCALEVEEQEQQQTRRAESECRHCAAKILWRGLPGLSCERCANEGVVSLGELAEWTNLEVYVLPALCEVFGQPLVDAVRLMWGGERRPDEVLRHVEEKEDVGESRSLKAIEGLLTLVNTSQPPLFGRVSRACALLLFAVPHTQHVDAACPQLPRSHLEM